MMIATAGLDAQVPDLIKDAPFSALLGTAGTGKSTIARVWAEQDNSVMLCATTGIAAVNLGTTTINSILWYFDSADLRQKFEQGTIQAALRKLRSSGYTRLCVDEVSMMDGEQLDILCYAIDEVNVGVEDVANWMKLTVVGDWCQLPPINAPYAFERPAWDRFRGATVTLTEPRRQADPTFVRALQTIRRGDANALTYFQPSIDPREEFDFHGTTIVALNAEVERINVLRLMKLPGTEDHFPSERKGKQRGEWKHIPEALALKPGAVVMLLANRYYGEGGDGLPELIYANGDLATYLEKSEDGIACVELFRTGRVVPVPAITRYCTQVTGAKGERKPREEVLGSIKYVPLRLAFASTVHKVQGLTLDNVQILIHNQFWTQPSMLYVGLSRARTAQGLRIVGTEKQFVKRVVVNPKVIAWL